ncbi:MAG: hypothetical protein QGF32_00070 [Candidatus Thalassarchaeaceae archaeon]|nr:hypothetical protein [Candidatus Thalassarchaeaceae archaeon]
MAAAGGVVAWGCSAMVILGVVTYVFFEILKRWRVGLRLSALDESLLHDDGVSIEAITEAPMGSSVVVGAVAEYVEDHGLHRTR